MSNPFIAQITLFGGNFAPRGWAYCDGQLLQIASNQALFSLLGTTFGGDGEVTFALPDLRGRVPVGPRQGPGLDSVPLGGRAGSNDTTLTQQQIPAHSHTATLRAKAGTGNTDDAAGNALAQTGDDLYAVEAPDTDMDSSSVTIANTGGGEAHSNMQPSLGVNYIIALIGIFPSPN